MTVSLFLPYQTVSDATLIDRGFRALEWFFKLFDSALIASFTVGLSLEFGQGNITKISRFSTMMLQKFHFAVFVALLYTFIGMAGAELAIPLVRQRQERMRIIDKYYREYITLAQKYIEQEQYELGIVYAKNAQALNPRAGEPSDLQQQAENALAADPGPVQVQKISGESPDRQSILRAQGQYSTEELLRRAEDSFELANWFDAHYFSELALMGAELDDADIQRMRDISKNAWERLSIPGVFIDTDARKLYQTKKAGYTALLEGKSLDAYYIFHDLYEAYPNDNDVTRYLVLATQQVQSSYFFLDEITDLPYFETIRDVYFSLSRDDGGQDILFCRGITALEDSGGFIQYLRLFVINSYDQNGQFIKSIQAPYAKLFEMRTADLPLELKKALKLDPKIQNIPCVLLEGVDRDSKGVVSAPEYMSGSEQIPHQNTLYLNLPYEDLLQIITVCEGVERISMPELYRFIPNAPKYGFSSEVLLQVLISRLCYPFILVILFLVFAIFAWNYRANHGQLFKIAWLIILPALTGVNYFILEIVLYLEKLLNYTFIGIFHNHALFAVAGVLTLFIIGLSVRFLSLRSLE
ncbi:MAG: hypothetical protein LBS97_00700 [Treponema sp.]|nr:hypothetical protein [Treponema sp.]